MQTNKDWARDALHSLLVQVLNKSIALTEMQRTDLERELRKLRAKAAERRELDGRRPPR